eukprot:11716853-Alexandrium_andersonii.AAC.1
MAGCRPDNWLCTERVEGNGWGHVTALLRREHSARVSTQHGGGIRQGCAHGHNDAKGTREMTGLLQPRP